jgi:two-component system, NarL family, nitrate/nitrite response regulator NarL
VGRVTIIVADDPPVYRTGLGAVIEQREELELLAECGDGRTAVAEIRARRPDVALLDVRMDGLDGIAVLDRLGGARSPTRAVFLSAFADGDVVARALGAGAAGFLSKSSDRDDICDAILAAAGGRIVLSPDLQESVLEELRRPAPPEHRPLSGREVEIMRCVARGMSAPETAARLGIAPSTVKTHLQRVYRKLGVADRAAMVAEAMRCGFLS